MGSHTFLAASRSFTAMHIWSILFIFIVSLVLEKNGCELSSDHNITIYMTYLAHEGKQRESSIRHLDHWSSMPGALLAHLECDPKFSLDNSFLIIYKYIIAK